LIFLEDGRIAASGTYDDLLQNTAFRHMVDANFTDHTDYTNSATKDRRF
jgi:hypothetical protein